MLKSSHFNHNPQSFLPKMISRLSQGLGPGLISGITFDKWLQLLNENQYEVDFRLSGKGVSITILSLYNSLLAGLEKLLFGQSIEQTKIFAPIFILGVWRSGTTFLHNILSKDPQFAYPTRYQVRHPSTFLMGDPFVRRLPDKFSARKRIQDNIWMSLDSPDEDEIALCQLSLRSPILSYIFPRRAASYFERYDTFENAGPDALLEWQSALNHFLAKLTYRNQRPLLLKSPDHTGRLQILATMFPEARFILVHRNPFAVFQSTLLTHQRTAGMWSLQTNQAADFGTLILERNQRIFQKLFVDLKDVSTDRICQVSFEQLESNPFHHIKRIYSQLELPNFKQAEDKILRYVQSLSGYQKNQHEYLNALQKQQVYQFWKQAFDYWEYAK